VPHNMQIHKGTRLRTNPGRFTWLPLFTLAALCALPAPGATLVVTSNADSGAGTLRAAIASANSGDTITFTPGLPSPISLTSGELLLTKNLTISGPASSMLAISGFAHSRVFEIQGGVNAVIVGLTITGGANVLSGGGILNNGTLTL